MHIIMQSRCSRELLELLDWARWCFGTTRGKGWFEVDLVITYLFVVVCCLFLDACNGVEGRVAAQIIHHSGNIKILAKASIIFNI